MRDRSIRSLAHLQGTSSTARTLNLHAIWEKFRRTPAHGSEPFFQNPVLNRAIILKHRLRRNEHDIFSSTRTGGTKVILPLDPLNLRAGGRYFFVGQRGYSAAIRTILGDDDDAYFHDRRLLSLLDELPSFDPFLLREAMKRERLRAAPCYFHVSDADTRRMLAFVHDELAPLVGVSFDGEIDFVSRTAVLAAKIMSNDVDAEMEPLRETLKLSKTAFEDGVFCWKGFIYYKWNLADLLPRARQVLAEIGRMRPRGLVDDETWLEIRHFRSLLKTAVTVSIETVQETLAVYERAYEKLSQFGQPVAFREFLLEAPDLFAELGERLGAINHMVSFWRFRFPQNEPVGVAADELLEIFADFETSLNFREKRSRLAA